MREPQNLSQEADWDPGQYGRFAAERSQPFWDLVDLVDLREGMRIADLGCGTGELTAELHDRSRSIETLGIDASAAMLERISLHTRPGLRFEKADLASWDLGTGWDLILSNAVLHFLENHEDLLGRWRAALAPGGQLAIQLPANHDHPIHEAARDVAEEPRFRTALREPGRAFPPLALERYAEILDALGFERPIVRMQVYLHQLKAREEMVEWAKGSVLVDYRRRLPKDLFPEFLARYQARLFEKVGPESPCLLTYKRIFLWGKTPSDR